MNELFTYDETINASLDNRYLISIIPDRWYKKWFALTPKPKIYILNKGICANGGTTGFINYAKLKKAGVDIAVPNRSIVQSKEFDDELCCVYGGSEHIDPTKPIRLSTWDSLLNVMKEHPTWGFLDNEGVFSGTWRKRCLVIDEYDKLVADSNFRDICEKMIRLAIKTNLNVVLMSATPNTELCDYLKKYSGKEVVTQYIKYPWEKAESYPYVKQIDFFPDIKNGGKSRTNSTRNIVEAIVEAKEPDEHICIFYNNVKNCASIVHQSLHKDDMEILCSKANKEKDIPNYSEKFNTDKHIHFLTSAFFTGHDINVFVNKVVIVGGTTFETLAYTAAEIKQIAGRFRNGYGKLFCVKQNKSVIAEKYALKKTEYEVAKKSWEDLKESAKKDPDHMQKYLDMVSKKQRLDAIDGWENVDTFKEMMSVFGGEFFVVEGKIGTAKNASRRRTESFRQFRDWLVAEYPASLDETNWKQHNYRDRKVCVDFAKLYGVNRCSSSSIYEMKAYMKYHEQTDGVDLDRISEDELFKTLINENGIYTARYLEFLVNAVNRVEPTDSIVDDVSHTFNCICGYYDGRIGRERYIVIKVDDRNPIVKDMFSWEKVEIKHLPVSCFVKTQDHHNFAKTVDLFSIPMKKVDDKIKGLGKVLTENPSEMKKVNAKIVGKDGKEHKTQAKAAINKLFKNTNGQTFISELYKPDGWQKPYRQVIDNMTVIHALIVDIDGTIPYSEFKKEHASHYFIAYPTIGNDDDDWTKFRVIFPLARELKIHNENLATLKMLRRMFCQYEDKCHQIGSFSNAEQFGIREVNKGDVLDISQETVDYIHSFITNLRDCSKLKYNVKDGKFTGGNWDFQRGLKELNDYDKDGERHWATFRIKANMDEDNRKLFRDWLAKNRPELLRHWDSHKKI